MGCKFASTNQIFAIKCILIDSDERRSAVDHEIELLRGIRHNHIVSLLDAGVFDNLGVLVQAYGGCELFEMVERREMPFPTHAMFAQLATAIEYLHAEAHVVHRDLKLENVLVDHTGHVSLIDFGLAFRFEDPLQRRLVGRAGSATYVAPEVCRPHLPNGFDAYAADMWSLGVLLYAMCNYHLPHPESTLEDLCRHFDVVEAKQAQGIPPVDSFFIGAKANLEASARALISGLLTMEVQRRYNIHEVLRSSYLHGCPL